MILEFRSEEALRGIAIAMADPRGSGLSWYPSATCSPAATSASTIWNEQKT